jgi:hypothetical protein
MTESNLTWYDGFLKKGMPYPIISLIIGVIIYVIFLFLGRMMGVEWYPEDKIGFMLMGILIAYQLSGIQYLLDKFKKILLDICLLSNVDKGEFCIGVKNRFAGSMWYYALLALVILPFYLTDWISSDYTLKENYSLMEQFLPNYFEEPSSWILIYDIYCDLLGILALLLLAYILWIVLNITWTLKMASLNFHSLSTNANVFSIYMKLRPIKSSILSVLFYYFICISLLILSYGLSGYLLERITLVFLLLIGLIFFFVGYESLYEIVRRQEEFEVDQINLKSREYTQKLLAIDSNGNYDSRIQETNFISNMLDVLQKQRDSLIKANTRIYDVRSIVSIIGAFLLPILADFAKKNIIVLLESGDIANQGISILNSLINKII